MGYIQLQGRPRKIDIPIRHAQTQIFAATLLANLRLLFFFLGAARTHFRTD